MKLSYFKVTITDQDVLEFLEIRDTPSIFNARCYEFPPQYRTIKITKSFLAEQETDDIQVYIKFPYIQLYLTDITISHLNHPLSLLSATQNPMQLNPQISPIKSILRKCIVCWGHLPTLRYMKPAPDNELLNLFWNSSFEISSYRNKQGGRDLCPIRQDSPFKLEEL